MYKSAIVGCGNIAGLKDIPGKNGVVLTHAQAYHRHPSFKIVAAIDNNTERLELFREKWNVPFVYKDLNSLLEHNVVDVISISSSSQHHAWQIEEIINSKNCPKVIFVEKPVCKSNDEYNRLKKILNNKECKVMVNHTRRFDPGHIRLMNFIQEGKLGGLLNGRVTYYGGWINNGSHVVDTLSMLFGKELIIQSATVGSPGREYDHCYNVTGLISGATIEIEGFDEKHYQLYDSEFRFEKGRVILRDFGSEIIIEEVMLNEVMERVLKPAADSPWKGIDSPMYHAVDLICRYLNGNDSFKGRSVLLEEVEVTMDKLWSVIEYGENV